MESRCPAQSANGALSKPTPLSSREVASIAPRMVLSQTALGHKDEALLAESPWTCLSEPPRNQEREGPKMMAALSW